MEASTQKEEQITTTHLFVPRSTTFPSLSYLPDPKKSNPTIPGRNHQPTTPSILNSPPPLPPQRHLLQHIPNRHNPQPTPPPHPTPLRRPTRPIPMQTHHLQPLLPKTPQLSKPQSRSRDHRNKSVVLKRPAGISNGMFTPSAHFQTGCDRTCRTHERGFRGCCGDVEIEKCDT